MINNKNRIFKPKIRLPNTDEYNKMSKIIKSNNLHTICSSGRCPNAAECWGNGTATFMILGDICTRSCKFCNVKTGKPNPVDDKEPLRIASSVKIMKLKHAVVTSVNRDDLEDGGASVWAETILKIKELNPDTTLEVLIPDFQGKNELIQKIIDAKPEVISHNMETVRKLTSFIRSKAEYEISISVLKYIVDSEITAKSGIMLGLGETENEVLETMDDLSAIGVKVFTLGQYLQPSAQNTAVLEYITLEKFKFYEKEGLKRGFKFVESNPLVRSSYHAERHVKA
jgi:lipoic acid synthetase